MYSHDVAAHWAPRIFLSRGPEVTRAACRATIHNTIRYCTGLSGCAMPDGAWRGPRTTSVRFSAAARANRSRAFLTKPVPYQLAVRRRRRLAASGRGDRHRAMGSGQARARIQGIT